MWLMYLWIMIGAYTYPKLFLHVNRIHGYLGCIIAFYLSGILGMTIFIVRCRVGFNKNNRIYIDACST